MFFRRQFLHAGATLVAGGALGTASATQASATTTPHAPLNGLDVSHYQGKVSWDKVADDGVHFSYAKATEGGSNVDIMFEANWKALKPSSIAHGAYQFYHFETDPTRQYDLFTKVVPPQSKMLPPAIDVEKLNKGAPGRADRVATLHKFLEKIEAAYGVKPIIYCSHSFWDSNLDDSFGDYPLWIAQYGVHNPRLPKGWTKWLFWQHTQSGTATGIQGDVDLDDFQGRAEDLLALRTT